MESENTQSTEEEIKAALDLREPQFDRYPYSVEYWSQWDGTRVRIRKHNTLDCSKPRTVPSIAWLLGYKQAALDLLRLQRREAKIAAMEAKPKQYNSVQDMVDATSPELSQEFRDRKPNGERIRELTEEEEPCSCCYAVPSSFKVEMLPREITWREVEKAVLLANRDKRGVRLAFFVVGGIVQWIIEYVDGEALWNGIGADEALSYLRELAQPKPEPITPEKLWAECGGTGPIPEWAREAALAEAGRRNAKGGE